MTGVLECLWRLGPLMVFVMTPVPFMVVQPVVVAMLKNEVDSGRIQLTNFYCDCLVLVAVQTSS